ncbi:hypothetical protein GCM10027416_25560 [Okibacterium endophyticum]
MSSALAPILFWITVTVLALAIIAVCILAIRMKKNDLISIAAGLLALVIVLVSLPMPPGPPVVTVVLAALSVLISVLGGGPAATYVLRLATKGSVRHGTHGGILVAVDADPAPRDTTAPPPAQHEVLRGGLTIGVLERLAVTASLLAGFPEAIAVVVAIKGVGRFTELAAAEARERFIIGTLASLIWACGSAALTLLAA